MKRYMHSRCNFCKTPPIYHMVCAKKRVKLHSHKNCRNQYNKRESFRLPFLCLLPDAQTEEEMHAFSLFFCPTEKICKAERNETRDWQKN